MKKVIVLFALLISPLFVLATAQMGDILIWNRDTLTVFSNPLESRPGFEALREKLFGDTEASINTACWRGYIAEWTIIGNELYLTNIFNCNYKRNKIKADLGTLFDKEYRNNKVKANWVTGDLLVPKGELIHYVHSGYESFYEREVILTFENGKIVSQKLFDNSKSHKSIFKENQDSLGNFIYSNINWKIIPKLKGQKVRVVASILSGQTTKPDSIKIVKGVDNEVFNNEALRVLKMLPDWDIYYRFGKVYPVKWILPIVFDEEKRRKYAK